MSAKAVLRIKVCGVTSPEDAQRAVAAGADAIGLNFYPPSPRSVSAAAAAAIAQALPPAVTKVGVFVDWTVDAVCAMARQVGLDVVQLHGDEPPGILEALAPLPVIRALRLENAALAQLEDCLPAWLDLPCPPSILVDAAVPGALGGTGQTADWPAARRLREKYTNVHFILAGGLTPDNVEQAIVRTGFPAVDTASGVESAPGRKEEAAMRQFVSAAERGWSRLGHGAP